MGISKIEWLCGEDGRPGKTWNPIKARTKEETRIALAGGQFKIIPAGKVGYHCERISPGCKYCYAKSGNCRCLPAWGTGLDYTKANRDRVEIFLDQKVLGAPLRWKRHSDGTGARIFPCSMTDCAAEFVPFEFLTAMLGIAERTPWNTYLFLTKRADRLLHYLEFMYIAMGGRLLPNVWMGFSAETQKTFDERWVHMERVAALGWPVWCSYEPALQAVNFAKALRLDAPRLHWLVIGGESGAKARAFYLDWAFQAITQGRLAGVPAFMKQAGAQVRIDYYGPFDEWAERHGREVAYNADGSRWHERDGQPRVGSYYRVRLKNRKGADLAVLPEEIRVRQYPRLAVAA